MLSIAVAVEGRDGGYEDTAAMVGEAALLLLEPGAREAMPHGGVFTPSAAFGDALRERLNVQGVHFDLSAPLPAGGHGCSAFAPRGNCA